MSSDYKDEGPDFSSRRMQVACAQAEAKGCVVVVPQPSELFVDIDSEDAYQRYVQSFGILREYGPHQAEVWPSPSGDPNHYHAYVWLENATVDQIERVALQSILGSDPVRELLSLARIKRGASYPTLFFEKPEGAAWVEEWRETRRPT